MHRIAALLIAALLIAAPATALPAQEIGRGIAALSCGAASDQTWLGALANAERGAGPDKLARVAVNLPQAQWMRRADLPSAEPGLWVLLVAGFLGMWAVARRRDLSS